MSIGWQSIDDALAAIGLRFGAPTPGQTLGGDHNPASEHYQGRARDYGDANSDVTGITNTLLPFAVGPGAPIDELFSSRDNVFYKNGAPITPDPALRQDHYDHVHVGLRPGVNLAALINTTPNLNPTSPATPVPVASVTSTVTKGITRLGVEAVAAAAGVALVVLGVFRATHH